MRVSLHRIAAVILFGSRLFAQDEDLTASNGYRAGYKLGIAEAEKELKGGHPTLYVCGLRTGFLEHLDKETGLPYEVIAGCTVDDQILGRERGHDTTIRAHIKAHGLPESSFKKWEKELFNLKRYYDARVKTEKPISLAPNGPKQVSPDGKFTISPVPMTFEKDDGTMAPVLGIIVATLGEKPVEKKELWPGDETDFFWGPDGSRFIVMRCRASKTMDIYSAFDLKRTAWLRCEADLKDKK
jgi:hypothetical protein